MSNDDILMGMKEISGFLKVSRRVVSRWMAEYPDIPIIRDGGLHSNAALLGEWHRKHVHATTSGKDVWRE